MERDRQSLRDVKLSDLLGPRNSVTASAVKTPSLTMPSSSLSLRYTGMISSSSFFNATVTSRQSQPAFLTHW